MLIRALAKYLLPKCTFTLVGDFSSFNERHTHVNRQQEIRVTWTGGIFVRWMDGSAVPAQGDSR